jgi:hypothetical protein
LQEIQTARGNKKMATKYYESGNAFSIDESGRVSIRNNAAIISFSYSEFGSLIKDLNDFFLTHVLPFTHGTMCFDCQKSCCTFNGKYINPAIDKIAPVNSDANFKP